MKRIIYLILILAVMLSFSACEASEPSVKSNESPINVSSTEDTSRYEKSNTIQMVDSASPLDVLYLENDNYKIYTNENKTAWKYIIFDNLGFLMDKGYLEATEFEKISNQKNLLALRLHSMGNMFYTRYYDVTNGSVSRFFSNPVAVGENLVAYYRFRNSDNKIVLIVQHVFDAEIYYKEIERDFSDRVLKSNEYQAEFIENDKKLKVTYPVNNNNQTVSETIELN